MDITKKYTLLEEFQSNEISRFTIIFEYHKELYMLSLFNDLYVKMWLEILNDPTNDKYMLLSKDVIISKHTLSEEYFTKVMESDNLEDLEIALGFVNL